jgi:hypothetical protein
MNWPTAKQCDNVKWRYCDNVKSVYDNEIGDNVKSVYDNAKVSSM